MDEEKLDWAHREAEYELEPREWGTALTWAIILLMTFSLLGWGMLSHHLVGHKHTVWQLGDLPDAPGESIYAIEQFDFEIPGTKPQMAPLPGAEPTRVERSYTENPGMLRASDVR